MGIGGPLASFIHKETASLEWCHLETQRVRRLCKWGCFFPSWSNRLAKGTMFQVGGSKALLWIHCFSLLHFMDSFPEKVSLSWFLRAIKHFSLITVKGSFFFFAFSRQGIRKKLAINCHIWNKFPSSIICRGRSYPDNLTKRRERGRTIFIWCPKTIQFGRQGADFHKCRMYSIAFQNPKSYMWWHSRRGPWEQTTIQRLGRGGGQQEKKKKWTNSRQGGRAWRVWCPRSQVKKVFEERGSELVKFPQLVV